MTSMPLEAITALGRLTTWFQYMFSVEPAVRRRRIRRVAWTALVLIAVAAAAGAGYSYRHERERRRVEAERARVEAERQARQREFVAAFASAAPRPTWWDEVATPYRVDNVGDLLAAWQETNVPVRSVSMTFFQSARDRLSDGPAAGPAAAQVTRTARCPKASTTLCTPS